MDFPKWYNDVLNSNCHVFIAGTTGSGKSVLLNGLICRALCNHCGLILIDPKKVELFQYTSNNHTMRYADTPDTIIKALKDAIALMYTRLENMRKARQKTSPCYPVYIVIDELADLINTCKKEIEPLLIKLTTLGRAARIHVIACTQKLKGVASTWLRTNFDYRIALRCSSPLESMGIIEVKGAENLPRYGKALVKSPNYMEIFTGNVFYYPDHEINNFINCK